MLVASLCIQLLALAVALVNASDQNAVLRQSKHHRHHRHQPSLLHSNLAAAANRRNLPNRQISSEADKARGSLNLCYEYSPKCTCPHFSHVECRNFTSLSELNFTSKQIQLTSKRNVVNYLEIEPLGDSVQLDESLDLDGLWFRYDRTKIVLSKVNSFELTANPFANLPIRINLYLKNSSLNFLYREREFDWICDLVVNDNTYLPLFASFKMISFGLMSTITYPKQLCPAIFKNALIDTVCFYNLTEGNRPNFIRLKDTNPKSLIAAKSSNVHELLNSRIKQLHIQSSDVALDSKLLDRNVFYYLEKLVIELSNLTSIEENVFEPLKHLKRVQLSLYNFESFIRNQDLAWMRHLNGEISVRMDNETELDENKQNHMELELTDESRIYDYPDRDFCMFRNFPHSKLVFPVIKTAPGLNCSCTLLWLLKHHKVSTSGALNTSSVSACLESPDLDKMMDKCNFNSRLKRCAKHSHLLNKNSYHYETSRAPGRHEQPRFYLMLFNLFALFSTTSLLLLGSI